MIVPCNTKTHRWVKPDGTRAQFAPRGQVLVTPAKALANPAEVLASPSDPTWSARLFVGLNVGGEPRWKIEDVVRIVRAFRRRRGEQEDSSFLLQRGVYTHWVDRKVVEEDSVQVIMIKVDDSSPLQWRVGIVELAEHLAEKLDQESVIVEFQLGGVSQATYSVTP